MSKEKALISATKDLLWERGYAATSPRDILRKSRAGQGSLYHFFEGKQALAEAALKEMEKEFVQRVEKLSAGSGSPGGQRLRRYLTAERAPLRGCRLGRLAQDPELPEPLRRVVAQGFQRIENILVQAIRDAQKDGELPQRLDAEGLAEMVIAVVQGGYVLARAHNDPSRMVRALSGVGVLLDLLGAKNDK
jgi:TetR/AcrR family transcriptional regulator, transcriptional repressor for nem operon